MSKTIIEDFSKIFNEYDFENFKKTIEKVIKEENEANAVPFFNSRFNHGNPKSLLEGLDKSLSYQDPKFALFFISKFNDFKNHAKEYLGDSIKTIIIKEFKEIIKKAIEEKPTVITQHLLMRFEKNDYFTEALKQLNLKINYNDRSDEEAIQFCANIFSVQNFMKKNKIEPSEDRSNAFIFKIDEKVKFEELLSKKESVDKLIKIIPKPDGWITFLSAIFFERVGRGSSLRENLSENWAFDKNVLSIVNQFVFSDIEKTNEYKNYVSKNFADAPNPETIIDSIKVIKVIKDGFFGSCCIIC